MSDRLKLYTSAQGQIVHPPQHQQHHTTHHLVHPAAAHAPHSGCARACWCHRAIVASPAATTTIDMPAIHATHTHRDHLIPIPPAPSSTHPPTARPHVSRSLARRRCSVCVSLSSSGTIGLKAAHCVDNGAQHCAANREPATSQATSAA